MTAGTLAHALTALVLVLVSSACAQHTAAQVPSATPTASGRFSATFEADGDWGVAPFKVKFSAVVDGPTAPPYTYTWLFGDGSAPSPEESPEHVYKLPGEYWATLRIRDAAGATASYMAQIWVEADDTVPDPLPLLPFVATLELDTDWGDAPLTVKLNGMPSGAGGRPPFKYSWEFGDGSPPSSEEAPSHVYEAVGEYRPMLTIEAAGGRTARDYGLIWVEEPGMFGSAPINAEAPDGGRVP